MKPSTLFLRFAALALAFAGGAAPLIANGTIDTDKPSALTAKERGQLYELLLSSQARTLRLLADVPPELFERPPAAGKWSAAGVLEHLGRAEVAVRGAIQKMLSGEAEPRWRELEQPSLDQLVALTRDRSQKFQAPERLVPEGGSTPQELMQLFLAERATTLEFVRTVDQPLHEYAAMAPIGVELDAGLWIGLIAAHNERHNGQIAEIRAAFGLAAVD